MLKVNQKNLMAALKTATLVADPRSNMPILACALLRASEGVLTVSATDLISEVSVKLPCEGEIDVCVSAKALLTVVEAVTPKVKGQSPDVELSAEFTTVKMPATDKKAAYDRIEANVLVIGKAEIKMVATPSKDWPKSPVLSTGKRVEYDAPKLLDALDFVKVAASTDETRYHLNGILFKDGDMVTTDGHRLHRVKGMPACDGSNILPRGGALILSKLLKGMTEMTATFTGTHVVFNLGATNLCVKLIDAQFPPYEQVIPHREYCENGFTGEHKAFVDAVKTATVMSSDKTWGVKLVSDDRGMSVQSDNPDFGECRAPFASTPRPLGKLWKIGVNGKYLIEACEALPSDTVDIAVNGELDPVRLDDGDRTVVIMPMRI